MLEIPESMTIARQLNKSVKGKKIKNVEANHTPHKFAFYYGDPGKYGELLSGRTMDRAISIGGMVEMYFGDLRLVFGDGANFRYYGQTDVPPKKHQFKIEFEDYTALYSVVSMYGHFWAFHDGTNENSYYLAAKNSISPLCNDFNEEHFYKLLENKKPMSAKAFIATEQRIPGLGNGVAQDILWNAGIHPKRKTDTFTQKEFEMLFQSIKSTLSKMAAEGGRDTEKDLFGNKCGYQTILSKNTVGLPCPRCGTAIVKENYLGGSIYYCPECQTI